MDLNRILECVSGVTGLPIEAIRSKRKSSNVVQAKRIFMVCATDQYPSPSNYPRIAEYVLRDRSTMNANIMKHRERYNNPTHREYTDIFNKAKDRIVTTSESPKFDIINRLQQLYQQRIEVELAIATNEAALLAHDKMEGAK